MESAARAAITQGAIDAIFNQPERLDSDFPVPVVQVLQVKGLGSVGEGTPDRYRLVVSDLQNFVQCMLATQANHVIHDGKLIKGSFIRLKQYQANSVKGKRILIILDTEVIESLEPMEKIGEPTAVKILEVEDEKPTNTTIAGKGFYGNNPQPQQQQAPARDRALPSRAGPSSSSSHATIYPIEALSPYHHKWTIKARVSTKSDIRTWHKQNGEGKLFSVNLLDESGEIKATGFNEQCDALYDVFQEGHVYYITSPCRVQIAKKQFSNLANDYELMFERDTVVEKAEDQDNVPQIRYNFSSIADLQAVEKDTTVDVIAVLKEVGEVAPIVSKTTSKPYDKRELELVDETGYSVRLTIWGKTATSFDATPESVVAFKGVKVSDFGGRSLSLLSSGTMLVNPDIEEAHRLKGWYDSNGRTETFSSHAGMSSISAAGGRQDPLKTIAQVRDEELGMKEEPAYFSTRATVVYIKQDTFCYAACLSDKCNKKVTEMGDGTWRCEKCDISHPKPEYRYIMSLNVNDHTGQLWLSGFDDVGRLLMGSSADDLMELKENDSRAAEKVFERANCQQLIFKVRAKTDTYQDQSRIRYQVVGANPINYATDALKLAELIKAYNIE